MWRSLAAPVAAACCTYGVRWLHLWRSMKSQYGRRAAGVLVQRASVHIGFRLATQTTRGRIFESPFTPLGDAGLASCTRGQGALARELFPERRFH